MYTRRKGLLLTIETDETTGSIVIPVDSLNQQKPLIYERLSETWFKIYKLSYTDYIVDLHCSQHSFFNAVQSHMEGSVRMVLISVNNGIFLLKLTENGWKKRELYERYFYLSHITIHLPAWQICFLVLFVLNSFLMLLYFHVSHSHRCRTVEKLFNMGVLYKWYAGHSMTWPQQVENGKWWLLVLTYAI